MITYLSKFPEMKIVIQPERRAHDEKGNLVKIDGEYVKFQGGQFRTNDPKVIKFMEGYMKQWPGEVTLVDEEKLAMEREISARTKAQVEKEWAEKKTKKPVQKKPSLKDAASEEQIQEETDGVQG